MRIGEAAAASGVSAKMIRHYEATGLVPSAERESSNYRRYTQDDVARLAFIRRARGLGFSIEQIRTLVRLSRDGNRTSAAVKGIALSHVAALEAKIAQMQSMAEELRRLAEACGGDERPECPILRGLEGRRGDGDRAGRAAPGHLQA